jgi:cobalt-precorrin-5B (C1)-methyltransferase
MTGSSDRPERILRRGWTTGACATAAAKAAYAASLTGTFPDPVRIILPKGERPSFPLALQEAGTGWARAGIVKDAGDDPDVTHGCLVVATVRPGGIGTRFRAGAGVGVVTRPGLPLPVGEPAINPKPREMITAALREVGPGDAEIELSIPGGEKLAERTWNPRLGIRGGLSILGTTGIVHPFSCSAWIASIHRGVDVARAAGLPHLAGCTGSTSEDAVRRLHDLPLEAMIDMGDFVGGLLKYLRDHPVPRLTIGGGFAKMVKLAQGALDLHWRSWRRQRSPLP